MGNHFKYKKLYEFYGIIIKYNAQNQAGEYRPIIC